MRYSFITLAALGALATGTASAATFTFDTDPFAGSAALTTPGRQVVGGEPTISFDTTTDQFVFNSNVFAIGDTINFANDTAANLATSGLNVIVLQQFDVPFNAGLAANALAAQITADGAGFFIYFNSGLNLPRLVYSTNLNDSAADLKIIARMSNMVGDQAALAGFTADNFAITSAVPEPATWAMMIGGFAFIGSAMRRRKVTLSYT